MVLFSLFLEIWDEEEDGKQKKKKKKEGEAGAGVEDSRNYIYSHVMRRKSFPISIENENERV